MLASVIALAFDAVAVFAGFLLATWIRFKTGWIHIPFGTPLNLYSMYAAGAALGTIPFLMVFQSLGLYKRPQIGPFPNRIPRIVRGALLGTLIATVLAFALKNIAEFSSVALVLSFPTISFMVLLERYILFRIEWHYARHARRFNRVLIIGTDSVAAHIKRTIERERMLRSKVVGFLDSTGEPRDESITREEILGTVEDLDTLLSEKEIDQVILSGSSMGRDRIVDILMLCEKNLASFNIVPDLFSIITSSMDVQSMDDIPLLGMAAWPLDMFWNRALKRAEDIAGSLLGLILTGPFIIVAAIMVKRSSPGPAFYVQKRCGEAGKTFNLYKLRTMRVDAEADTGPVWAQSDDRRRTRIGAFLRSRNLDELPQLWNVLCGHMSLVGPRPERPHFVEKFRNGIRGYMWRHVSKPGITGWAQVNGLRGNTSIEERIKYDLYYLENWSIAFDFKIIAKSLFARQNAY